MKKLLLLLLAWAAPSCLAQGAYYSGNASTPAANVPYGAQAPLYTVPNAIITVCGYPQVDSPCTNTIPLFSDPGMTQAVANPVTADSAGRFGFWFAPGQNYTYSVQTAQGTEVGDFVLTQVPGGSSYLVLNSAATQTVTQSTGTTLKVNNLNGTVSSAGYTTIEQAVSACNGAVTCQIVLSTALTQASSGTYTIPAGIAVLGMAGGSIVPGAGNTLSFANSSFTGPAVPFFTGAGTIVGLRGLVPVEWFGAVGDATLTGYGTDNTATMQAAINSLSSGQILLGPLYYKACPLTITVNAVGIIGTDVYHSRIVCNSQTADQVDVNGASWGHFEHFFMQRIVHTAFTAGAGPAALSLVNTGGVVEDDLIQYDSPRGFYYNGAPSYSLGHYSNLNSTFGNSVVTNYTSADTLYGFLIDSQNDVAMNSGTFIDDAAAARGSAMNAVSVAFDVSGQSINDIDLEHLASSGLSYGTYISYTGNNLVIDSNSDIHFKNATFDQCTIACVYITGLSSDAPSPQITFNGGYLNTDSGAFLAEVMGSVGVSFQGMQLFAPLKTGGKGIYAHNSTAVSILDNTFSTFAQGAYGVNLNNCQQCIVTGNMFINASYSSNLPSPLAIGIEATGGTANGIIALNSFTDSITTGILEDSSSLNNAVGLNTFASSVTTPYSGFSGPYSGTCSGKPVVVAGIVTGCQ